MKKQFYDSAKYFARRVAGYCVKCRIEKAIIGECRCAGCKAKQKAKEDKKKAALLSAGLCTKCGEWNDGDTDWCEECKAEERERCNARYAESCRKAHEAREAA